MNIVLRHSMATNLKTHIRTILMVSVLCVLLSGCKRDSSNSAYVAANSSEAKIPETVDFIFDVKPILSDRCFICHGPDKNAVEGNLSLHSAEEAYKALGQNLDRYAIVPGDTLKSELVHRIFNKDEGIMMPPPESNLSLTNYEKEVLKKWIEQGAEYKTHWSFVAPEAQDIPQVNSGLVANEIDNFVLKKIDDKGLKSSKTASKEKLIRRVSFDLTGLPPSQEAIQNFVNDTSENAFEKVIDTLLNSTDYAENMALEWMDISRYADTHGYQNDFERTMWPWRDWVIHAFNKNMPYNEFVTYQLAGDLLPNATKEQILATGFNRNHKITGEVGIIEEEYRVEYVEDRTKTFGIAFLGLTFECARCHDHKYDPISQKEHFEMYSFFNNVDEKVLMADPTVIPEPHLKLTAKDMKGVLDFIDMELSPEKEIPAMVMREMKDLEKLIF
ncbi:DUF1549 domain-containing protein [Flavobacteriaceae bacterium]|nr:DUF1549 domain-containing protein [Flavobacteriaceae bacterium]